ncbi:hypothetical protein HDV01_006999 [Terramyces sp. JEL0728]|nr:hypothetical protein HDV01_006999 [Terramyces sp. JEL0728]
MADNSLEHVAVPASVPPEFPEILRDLNRAILKAQPADIITFCADYFKQKLEQQGTDKFKLANTAKNPTDYNQIHDSYTMQGTDSGEVEEQELEPLTDDEDDDELPEFVPPPVNPNRGRRTSVSAESMAPSSEKEAYTKVNIPKSDEQRKRIETAIHANFLFKSLDEEQYTDVVNAMAEKRVASGEVIITQGGIGDYFYVVESGALDVFVSRNDSPPIKVTDYGPNGSFGELALMYNAPRAATVAATKDCVLWALDRVTFRRILMENTSKKRRMYERFLEELPLLTSLEAYERHKIADALESVTFSDGEYVIKQGDVGDSFFIVESGEANVTQFDDNGVEHALHSLKKGDYFGGTFLVKDRIGIVNR